MSTNRGRALAYAEQVTRQSQKRRSNRPDNFTSNVSRPGPPSYDFADSQRGHIDDTSEQTKPLRQEEKDILNDKDRDVTDKKTFEPGPTSGKAPTSVVVTKSQTKEVSELKNVFRKCWITVDTINIPPKAYDEKSRYTPNAIMLFNVLFELEDLLIGNEDLRWTSPNYFSAPVRVYYSVIFFVQVLRAKEQAGKLEKAEGSWLRAFMRRFKDSLCPIVGPLVPYFTNIVTVLPDDNQFEYVYPSMEKKGTFSAGVDDVSRRTPVVRNSHFLVPSVPLIASLLKDFCTTMSLDDSKFDEAGSYIPFSLATGGNFAGIEFPPNAGQNTAFANLLANPVLMKPLPESRDRLIEIHSFWKRSNVKNIPDIPLNQPFNPELPSGWTLMEDDFDWFQKCIDMATVQCKYFSDSTNLSAIPTTGGNSALVVANIQLNVDDSPPNRTNTWFQNQYSSMKSTFESSTAGLDLDDIYQAAYAITNANLTWRFNEHKIGSVESGLRHGPYFTENKTNYSLDFNVSVGSNVYTMVQSQFYDAHATH